MKWYVLIEYPYEGLASPVAYATEAEAREALGDYFGLIIHGQIIVEK